MSTWLSPLSAASARASYKGEVDGTTYGALDGELLHHFQIKPLEAEHISLDFYSHLVGPNVIPAFVQLRIGSDLDEKDVRFIAYRFDSFQPLQSLPAAGAIFNPSISPDPFNVTHCYGTLAYTDQDQEGTKIHPDNKITSTDPLGTPLSRTALTYVLRDHPTWKASEIVAWEDELGNNFTEYVKYLHYIDPPQPEPILAALNVSGDDAALLSGGQINRRALSLNSTSNGRRLARVTCPAGYYDTTGGNANYWGCGCHCPGGCYTNGGCGCACQLGCVSAEPQSACPSAHMISSGGFPFSLADADDEGKTKSKQKSKDEAIFPCDIALGYPYPCKGSISCSTPDIPLCAGACGGLVTGSVSGGGSWDCALDFSSCTGSLSISGGVKVGIPNCKWCPPALELTVEYKRTMGVVECCSGPFAYTKDSITLAATVLVVVRAELSGTFYEMATKDDNACKTTRPNYIQNGLRKMVIAGKVEICFLFCFSIVSGNLFMVPEVALPVANHQKTSGQCCVLVNAWASRHSCEYCPGGHKFEWVWNCGASRRCS
jgi:hypothetical protein